MSTQENNTQPEAQVGFTEADIIAANYIGDSVMAHIERYRTVEAGSDPRIVEDVYSAAEQLPEEGILSAYDQIQLEKSKHQSVFDGLAVRIDLEKARLQDLAAKKMHSKSDTLQKSIDELSARRLAKFSEPIRRQQAEIQPLIDTETEKADAFKGILYVIASVYDVRHAERKRTEEENALRAEAISQSESTVKLVPTLSDRLKSFRSAHFHVYGGVETAYDVLERVAEKPAAEISEEDEIMVIQLKHVLPKFVPGLLERDGSIRSAHPLLRVYTAKELMDLQKRFREFTPKDRADFSGLEGRIIAAAEHAFKGPESHIPADLAGAKERAEQDKPNRSGMRWTMLCKNASLASDAIQQKMRAGASRNVYRSDYLFEAADLTGTDPDMSLIYQFIADEFALDVIGQRTDVAGGDIRKVFDANIEIIKQWRTEADELLTSLPKGIRVHLRKPKNKTNYRRYSSPERTWDPAFAIDSMIHKITVRGENTGTTRTEKPFKLDPSGALRHQLALGHIVSNLNSVIAAYKPEEAVETNVEVDLEDLL